ncbi:MAG: WYL domain-containing protein, partial [Candidatus Nanopelagicales bacterium]|nr:WYL domain-containing protein [Candidatus Nanopelagicales bacterium]
MREDRHGARRNAGSPEPIDRMIAISIALTHAGAAGKAALELADIVGYAGAHESRREMLARDIRGLRRSGLEIRNAAAPGEESRWVLVPGDSRVRVAFTASQRSELRRAALLADGRELASQITPGGPPARRLAPGRGRGTDEDQGLRIRVRPLPPELEQVQRAVIDKCLLEFWYNGSPRSVDPYTMMFTAGEWAVHGLERGTGLAKTFTVTRMQRISIGNPGSAVVPADPVRPSVDPLTWHQDVPIEAELVCPAEFAADVAAMLNAVAVPAATAAETAANERSDSYGQKRALQRAHPYLTGAFDVSGRFCEAGPPPAAAALDAMGG